MIIKPTTLRGYLQGISGLFISPDNPGGLTPKELDMLTAFLFVMKEEQTHTATTIVKSKVASMTNHSPQVITNYVKKLRDKRLFTSENILHEVLRVWIVEIHKPGHLDGNK